MSLEQIKDPLSLARVLSHDLKTRPELPTENDISEAVKIINEYYYATKSDEEDRTILRTAEAFFDLPDDPVDLELISERHIEATRVQEVTIRGTIHQYHWIGSVAITGFGIRLYGVDMISPDIRFASTAFVPVDAISLQLAAG